MPRPPRPISLLVSGGKKHLVKKEIAERIAAEEAVTIADGAFVCPKYVRENFVAFAKWRELMRLFKTASFISTQDAQHIAGYCMAHAELLDLREHRRRISEHEFKWEEEAEIEGLTLCTAGERASIRLWKKLEYIASTEGLLKIDSAIDGKARVLMAMEDRMYLNARARAAVPKATKPKEDPLAAQGFGNL